MSFFQKLIAGRGKLHDAITPNALQKITPKEISPNGFMPARDWLGIDGDGSLKKAAQAKEASQLAQEQQLYGGMFNQSANAQIPGLLGSSAPPGLSGAANRVAGTAINGMMNSTYTPQDWRGLLPGGTGTQIPQSTPVPFQPNGQYGQQAMQMAGLLGPGPIGDQMKGFRIPRYRPYGK